ncbi:MAG: Protein translocase subunit SecA [Parcubacteria group bacterium GW2011_GWF2_38_76]|nr:MAG: Protein translocase subunit SecA [Parcubacteria group bacterium GW2011_GWF2_38_76]
MYILDKIFGSRNDKEIKNMGPIVEKVASFGDSLKTLSDEQLSLKTKDFRERIAKGETLNDILPEAFAVVREVSTRLLNQRHYDVQIMGGIVLHEGKIAEMRTGEGKTLVATLPAYLNALAGHVHVVTVNDYLARRDSVWMGQIYSFLGLSVSVINHESSYLYDPKHSEADKERDELGSFKIVYEFLRPCTRREAYLADIVYGTNHEFGFDYLRDNIAYEERNIVQSFGDFSEKSAYNFAIIDEVDSILIDESRTPLIISAPAGESEDLYATFAKIASSMNEVEDYAIDEKLKAITLTDAGITKAEKALGVSNIYTEGGVKFVHHLESAVKAKALFTLDKDYVVKNGEVIIVDEFTGRLQPGRRWSDGLHQAIEAKEGARVQKESKTMATITIQNYFRMYQKLSGMTGTALTSAEEFLSVYNLDTIAIPPNKISKRKDVDDLVFQSEEGKIKAITAKIKELNKKGQPVLVGTVSIEKNEVLSKYLEREGIKHSVLNAKNHEKEGEIVAEAGKKGSVVIATNMAGRGVDIKLGGPMANKEEMEEIRGLGGLFVLGTERHDARRIDNQLRGRSGRQGDEGETQFFVSLEDPLIRIFASDMVKNMMGRLGIPEDEAIQNRLVTRSIESAQTKIEGINFDSRKHLLEYDDVMNIQRKTVYEKRRKILLGDKEYLESFLNEISAGDEDVANFVKKLKEELGEDNFFASLKILSLQVVDMIWTDHLEMMDHMRSSVRLRAYGQRDPLVEYKKEGIKLFREIEDTIADSIVKLLPTLRGNNVMMSSDGAELKEVHDSASLVGNSEDEDHAKMESEKEVVGRNEPCPCGSGKKYKKCCGNK